MTAITSELSLAEALVKPIQNQNADPQEEDVMLSAFDQVLNTYALRPALDDMVVMDVEADLEEISQ